MTEARAYPLDVPGAVLRYDVRESPIGSASGPSRSPAATAASSAREWGMGGGDPDGFAKTLREVLAGQD